MKLISVVTPCFNEEENVERVYREVREAFAGLPGYACEHLFIDNASRDRTVAVLKEIARRDRSVKIIVNTRNFGWIRSPYHALFQARGDAVILLAADLQDPPALIADFVDRWEKGYKVVLGVKTESDESPAMFAVRKLFYFIIGKLSEIELTKNNTGFGLYDRRVIEDLRGIPDTYPYFRGLVAELGYESEKIPYRQPARKRGITTRNFYRLYDVAILGITNHSKIPLRVATFLGFGTAILSLLVASGYFVAKLLFWDYFSLGIAPLITGLFFFASVQLFFIGVIGEYVGSIHTQVLKRPLVVEKERVNFDDEPPGEAV